MIKKPNFFIVGAPKCGTSAMYDYLREHPDVFMPTYKEPHFFARDFEGQRLNRFRDEKKYLALFKSAQNETRIGEASVWYLYSRVAAAELRAYDPDARIIVMLRSPVEMLYSLYHQLVYTRNEDLTTFREALAAEPDRKMGKRIPRRLHTMVETLYYRDIVKFTEQIQRYFDAFGHEQVHIIIYDDFKANTPQVYQHTLEFLEVDPDFVADFRVVNPNKFYRNSAFQEFLLMPPDWIMRTGHTILPVARRVYWMLRKLNARQIPRSSLNPELERELKKEFLPDIERLSELLGRDLTHWCQP